MTLRLFNTLTRKKEELKPLRHSQGEPVKDGEVGLYTCGPTVYNFAHIGNLRTYIFEDILERVLKYDGYKVKRVMNITDVGHLTGDSDTGDDKLDKEAQEEHKSVQEIAKFYTNAFLEDLKKLNIEIPNNPPPAPASEYIPQQIELIQKLFDKGYAYDTSTTVYFNVAKFEDYGKLSGQTLADKSVGVREEVIVDKEKKNPQDFALWFKLEGKFKNHLLHWPSPWGEGFPGWHIECSAISRHFLGQPFDIHTGGVDHIGTHHENEIAQSEAAYGVPLANIWMHGEHLIIDGAKMAKSKADKFITLSDLERKGYSPLVYRYYVLQAHYRTQLNFTWEALKAAKNGLENLLTRCLEHRDDSRGEEEGLSHGDGVIWLEKFKEAINDDLNTPKALAVTFEMVDSDIPAKIKQGLIYNFDQILGFGIAQELAQTDAIPQEITDKFREYKALRDNKQFIQSDELRKEIESKGYLIRDTERDSRLIKKPF